MCQTAQMNSAKPRRRGVRKLLAFTISATPRTWRVWDEMLAVRD